MRQRAVAISDGTRRDLRVYDWGRDMLTQLTFDPGRDINPVWTPDSRRLVFASDLMILPMEGDATRGWTAGTPTVFLSTPASKAAPMFSPDGRWIAYSSNEAGSSDVYVRPFPGSGGPGRISTAGGGFPRWSATAPELLFAGIGQHLIIGASYAVVGDSFRARSPKIWSPTSIHGVSAANAGYDLHPDGTRAAAPEASGARDKVVFVSNFGDYLRTIAPGTK